MNDESESVTIELFVIARTDAAICLSEEPETSDDFKPHEIVWIPLSQFEETDSRLVNDHEVVTGEIPMWLAYKKDMI